MAGELAAFKTTNVQFTPVPASSVPDGALFADENTGALSNQTASGPQAVGTVQQVNFKNMVAGGAILDKRPVAKRPDGKLVPAVSDGSGGAQQLVGYSLAAANQDGDVIAVLLLGVNVPGALTGLGFAPGDDVYLNEGGGYTNTTEGFTGDNDSIIKLGVADCADGIASSEATDLITFADVLTRP